MFVVSQSCPKYQRTFAAPQGNDIDVISRGQHILAFICLIMLDARVRAVHRGPQLGISDWFSSQADCTPMKLICLSNTGQFGSGEFGIFKGLSAPTFSPYSWVRILGTSIFAGGTKRRQRNLILRKIVTHSATRANHCAG